MSRSPGVSSRPAVGCSCSPGSAVPPARHHTSSSCCPSSSSPQRFPRETGEMSNRETLPHFCALVVQTYQYQYWQRDQCGAAPWLQAGEGTAGVPQAACAGQSVLNPKLEVLSLCFTPGFVLLQAVHEPGEMVYLVKWCVLKPNCLGSGAL